jgi:hypothetical protein
MPLVAASKKLVKFDPKIFLSTIDGGRKIAAFSKEAADLCSGRLGRWCFLFTEGKSKTHCCVEDREGSHNRHSERGVISLAKVALQGRLSAYAPQPQ